LAARHHAQPYPLAAADLLLYFTDAEIGRLKALLIMLNRRPAKHEPDALDQAGQTYNSFLTPIRFMVWNVRISLAGRP